MRGKPLAAAACVAAGLVAVMLTALGNGSGAFKGMG